MKVTKHEIKNIIINNLPVVVYVILIAFMHINMQIIYDDIHFSNALNECGIMEWLFKRYNRWSSRFIIEGIMVTVLKYFGMNVWKVLNIAVFLILPFVVNKLLNSKNDIKIKWIIYISIFLIPATCCGETGWVATSTNYLWPLTFGLMLCIPIKNNFEGKIIRKKESIIYLLGLIIAINQEQVAGVLAIIYFFTLCYNIIKKKKNNFIIIATIIILINIIFISICPGNSARKISEIKNWFPTYETFNIIEKIELAVFSTIKYITVQGRFVFLVFSGIILYAVFITNKSKIFRAIAILQFIGCLPLNVINGLIPQQFNILKETIYILNIDSAIINTFSSSNLQLHMVILYYILMLVCIVISIYAIFKNTKDTKIILSILAIGIVSKLVMAMSPTMFASAERVTIFLYMAFIIITIYILNYLKENNKKINIAYYSLAVIAMISYMSNFPL